MKLLNGFLWFVLTMPLLSANASQDNEPWVSLFNGKNLESWNIQCHPSDKNTTFWTVTGGAIEADSMDTPKHDYVWLLTDKEYGDFILSFSFQAFKNSPGNSGVQIRSRYDEQDYWLDGPQIDINPPGPWRCGMMWDETRGNKRWIYPDIPKGKWVNPAMAPENLQFYYAEDTPSWNKMVIVARGNQITARLNGVLITNFNGDGILDDATHQQYNVGQTGYIALQIHRNDRLKIRFKDLQIIDLSQ